MALFRSPYDKVHIIHAGHFGVPKSLCPFGGFPCNQSLTIWSQKESTDLLWATFISQVCSETRTVWVWSVFFEGVNKDKGE